MSKAVIVGRAARQNQKAMKWQQECRAINRQKAKDRLWSGLRRRMIIIAAVMVPAYIGLGAWWLWNSGEFARAADTAETWFLDQSKQVGFELTQIEVVGGKTLSAKFIAEKAGVQVGESMLTVSLHDMQQRLSELPELRSVSIQRTLPDQISITIEEREPFAIWQHAGKQQWVDRDGTVLVNQQQDMTQEYVVLVGEDVPHHAEAFLNMLEQTPALKREVVAGVHVGKRRWNVRLKNNILIKLPDHDAEKAWQRVALWVDEKKLLDRAIKMIDLRIEDRVFLTMDNNETNEKTNEFLTLTSARHP